MSTSYGSSLGNSGVALRGVAQNGDSDAVKLMLLSFDSTVKANLSVGFPLDLHIYKANSFKEGKIKRIEADNKYYSKISNGWSKALKSAFDSMPNFPIE